MMTTSAQYHNEPTPWMGIAERSAQYATQAWFAVLGIVLLRQPTTIEVRRD